VRRYRSRAANPSSESCFFLLIAVKSGLIVPHCDVDACSITCYQGSGPVYLRARHVARVPQQLICTEGSRHGSESFFLCPVCCSLLRADKDMDVSLPLPLTSCHVSSEQECPSRRTALGLASGRSRIGLSLCFPFKLLVFEVVSRLVCRAERISLRLTVAVLATLYFHFLKFH